MPLSLIKLKNIILDILFPPLCLNCEKYLNDRDKLICEQCLSLIKLNNTFFCPICRARLAENKPICHHSSLYMLAAAGNYDDHVLQNLIYYFKYQNFENLAPILSELLLKYLDSSNFNSYFLNLESYIIIPIPLYPGRKRERGFNQAKLLAEFIAKNMNLKLIEYLKRIKNTKPQSLLKGNEMRQKNVLNCFRIKNPDELKGKKVILIDDVFTSGATITEAAKILKTAGVKTIIALVIAKA